MKPRKPKARSAPGGTREPTEERTLCTHGDTYDDVLSRDDGLVATSSTHQAPTDRRPEEPSEAPIPDVSVDEPTR